MRPWRTEASFLKPLGKIKLQECLTLIVVFIFISELFFFFSLKFLGKFGNMGKNRSVCRMFHLMGNFIDINTFKFHDNFPLSLRDSEI